MALYEFSSGKATGANPMSMAFEMIVLVAVVIALSLLIFVRYRLSIKDQEESAQKRAKRDQERRIEARAWGLTDQEYSKLFV